ncbi:transketolase [Desulfospira joergensenii]|uniref:transketolase n=1 Tax=Desulfospira joergensenii TaxID=53329 RepID=UPI0003B6381F|nr:transketolase [Desulfospira joergensenii]
MKIDLLKKKSAQIRKDLLQMVCAAGTGHPGGSLSITDLLVYLYYHEMNYDPGQPQWEERDRLILSKGHSAPALFAILIDLGVVSKKKFHTLRKIGSDLQGHPVLGKTPGVDMTAGSLGMGLSAGVGMALSARYTGMSYKTYTILGDGELNEGQVWEAAMSAAHHKLDNLIAIVDYNKLQIMGSNDEVMGLNSLAAKWSSFNWNVVSCDGHNFISMETAFTEIKNIKNKPSVIIADTIKGKGVSYMENQANWHGSNVPSQEELQRAIKDIDGQ